VKSLAQTRAERDERKLDAEIDALIEARLKKANLAAPISSRAKVKLRGILKKYAKSPHPFRACVKDNMSRFGPGRTEAVCATLKDTIRGTKKWRGKSVKADEDVKIDADVLLALDAISEVDLQEILLEARALEEHGSVEMVGLLSVTGESEMKLWGDR
jgi:hypothetical protein